MIDWVAFLDSIGEPYTLGPAPNVRRDHVGINCPQCGDDNKHHFGINLETGKVRGCWRDTTHWMSPVQLVMELAHVSKDQALKILHDDEPPPVTDSASALLARLEAVGTQVEYAEPVATIPDGTHTFKRDGSRTQVPFDRYLAKRGYEQSWEVGEVGHLRWGSRGEWNRRIIFPLTNADRKLRGWTGRDITGTSSAKYRSWPAGRAVDGLVYAPVLGDAVDIPLVLCEGPMDALRICYCARVDAVAVLGVRAGSRKQAVITALVDKYRYPGVCVVLDRSAHGPAMTMAESLSHLGSRVLRPPEGVKDPGDMSAAQVRDLRKILLESCMDKSSDGVL